MVVAVVGRRVVPVATSVRRDGGGGEGAGGQVNVAVVTAVVVSSSLSVPRVAEGVVVASSVMAVSMSVSMVSLMSVPVWMVADGKVSLDLGLAEVGLEGMIEGRGQALRDGGVSLAVVV